jgi:outer membrane protein assembly factor BamB
VSPKPQTARVAPAEIVREYGPFPGRETVRGVTFDGEAVWFATDGLLQSFDPDTGELGRSLAVPADAGTAFDGRHLFQLARGSIQKIDPMTGTIVATFPGPAGAQSAGLTWAEGTLWLAAYPDGGIYQLDPESGRVLRILETARFVTGVTWVDDELWHGTKLRACADVDADEVGELRRIDPTTGELLERLTMPPGAIVTGLESDGRGLFFCGGGGSGKVRAVRRPAGPRAPRASRP